MAPAANLKRALICPHCEGRKIWRIERMQVPTPLKSRGVEPLGVVADGSIWTGYRAHGSFEVFICAACGFTEWYAGGIGDLQPDPARGIHLIDNSPGEGLR